LGLIEGVGKPWVLLNYISPSSSVEVGDDVVTAGLGGVFPAGIPVGRIESVATSPDGYFKSARVRSVAPLGSVREVIIFERRDLAPGSASTPTRADVRLSKTASPPRTQRRELTVSPAPAITSSPPLGGFPAQ